MEVGEALIVIAEDDDTYRPAPPITLPDSARLAPRRERRRREKILLCNMRRDVDDLIEYLDGLVAPGSEVCARAQTQPSLEATIRTAPAFPRAPPPSKHHPLSKHPKNATTPKAAWRETSGKKMSSSAETNTRQYNRSHQAA